MARQLLIQITETELNSDTVVAWLLIEDGQQDGKVMQGSLADAARYADNARVTVTVPAELVYLTRQRLPGKNRQRLLKAIPFALEDQLIDDIEDMHFALGSTDPQGLYWVAAVRRELMDSWSQALARAGLHPQVMIPDVMLLPTTIGEVSLLADETRCLLVLADGERYAIDRTNLELGLQKAQSNKNVAVTQVRCYSAQDDSELVSQVKDQFSDVTAEVVAPLRLIGKGLASPLLINLLQGNYSRREKRRHQFQVWYPAAALLAIWIVSRLLLAVVDNIQLSHQLSKVQQQQQQVYRQAFPAVRPGGDVYRKMEAKLKELQQKRGQANASFYAMLDQLAPILGSTTGLQVTVLRYHDGRVDLELRLPSLQSLDQLKASLVKQPAWQVEIQSASSNKNQVEARLQIRSQT